MIGEYMITSRKELKRVLGIEQKMYLGGASFFHKIRLYFTNESLYRIWMFVKYLRKCEYWRNKKSFISKAMLALARRRKNKLGLMLGIEIKENSFDEGLLIYHGNIVVNRDSKIGKNCKLHGMNCIGNNGKDQGCPSLGNNVDLGIGSSVIGRVNIADNTIIGAGAVLVKNVEDADGCYVGVPARKITI